MEKSETQTTAVQTKQTQPIALELTPQDIEIVKENIWLCEQLVTDVLEPGVDWGTIPNVPGVSLWDPGAAKIMAAFNSYPVHNILSKTEEDGLISFTIECNLVHRQRQQIIGNGIGACSTRETKYKYRWLTKEDALREGYSDAELKVFKRRQEKYRVPNPEYGELVNTIVKMAAKRSEVDAAQSLPGVASALRKLFTGMDIPNWKAFEAKLQVIGLNHENARAMLGINSFKADWLDKKRTLDEAYQILKQKVQGKPTPPAEGKDTQWGEGGPPSGEEPEIPTIDTELLKGWGIVKSTVKELKLTDSQLAKWFNRYDLVVTLADFEGDVPPPRVTSAILSHFQTGLDSYRDLVELAKQRKRNK